MQNEAAMVTLMGGNRGGRDVRGIDAHVVDVVFGNGTSSGRAAVREGRRTTYDGRQSEGVFCPPSVPLRSRRESNEAFAQRPSIQS